MNSISSYYVETHEYNWESGLFIQVEYSQYDTDASDWAYKSKLDCLHHTLLILGVF